MRISLFALLIVFASCSVRPKLTANTCGEGGANIRGIIGTRNCRSISIVNGVIVRAEETNPQLLKSVAVVKCPESYVQLADIGTNGFILINTSQKFDYTTPSAVDFKSKDNLADRPKMYFLNGFLISSDTLKISPKAIQRIQVLNANKFNGRTVNDNTVLINIWTLTKKEVRKSRRKCSRSIMRD